MVYAPYRRDLKRLPVAKLPELLLLLSPSLQALLANLSLESLVPHIHEEMRVILHALADEEGFTISERVLWGPPIIWLQNGGFRTRRNQICFCIIIPRPKSRVINLEEGQQGEEEEAYECVFECTIRRPIAEGQFVSFSFSVSRWRYH
ncbi:hypothetical protein TGAM01_v207814 [Trichoderma gamsii]|uniref:Uncharacterized protein n=1 Tax=Trichoderma gamsii TaxID=398673 RepID=A0A2P4ZG94_9HYPO|nr:hypothetical protein TGAM01_v207814 [Trichoderma gamsii]PON23287.1 hypothetical protein TGAM01_v207814 [Trichoderma gamsii]